MDELRRLPVDSASLALFSTALPMPARAEVTPAGSVAMDFSRALASTASVPSWRWTMPILARLGEVALPVTLMMAARNSRSARVAPTSVVEPAAALALPLAALAL